MITIKECVVWGCGNICSDNILSVKYHESQNRFKVIGITSNLPIYDKLWGYPFVKKEEIDWNALDFVVVMAAGKAFAQIKEELHELGIPDSRIWKHYVFQQPAFDTAKYESIADDPPSILSMNCWGGVTYHRLGLEFQSPFINMFLSDHDFLKFLTNPRQCIDSPLSLKEMRHEPVLDIEYPVVECGDILLHFNHVTSFDKAREDWDRRKERINWDNLFIEMHTQDRDIADAFADLPYDKKICFVPFETDKEGLFTIPHYEELLKKEKYIGNIVVGMALGAYQFYDVFELLQK